MLHKIFYVITIFNQSGYINNNKEFLCDKINHICCQNLNTYIANMSCLKERCTTVYIQSLSRTNINIQLPVYASTSSKDMYNSYLKNSSKLGFSKDSSDLMTFQVMKGTNSNMRYKYGDELCYKSSG